MSYLRHIPETEARWNAGFKSYVGARVVLTSAQPSGGCIPDPNTV